MSLGVVLVHGGFAGERMTAERFWVDTRVVAGLVAAGLDVSAPDRKRVPSGWADEGNHRAEAITGWRRPAAAVPATTLTWPDASTMTTPASAARQRERERRDPSGVAVIAGSNG